MPAISSGNAIYVKWNAKFCSGSTAWWRHQMEIFSALLALCAGNSPVSGEFPAQRPVTRSFDVFFDLRLNTRLSKPSWGWWFETPTRPSWRHRNGVSVNMYQYALLCFGFFWLTHPPDKMATISQTIFSDAFLWLKRLEFGFDFH